MGSFLSRSLVVEDSSGLAGLVLSGTAGDPGLLGKVGAAVAAGEARLRGRRHQSALMDKLTFGQYNAAFKPTRTDFDWLSRDPDEVDAYVADPLCGNTFTSGFFVDLLGGLAGINDPKKVARVRRDLPVLLVSGDADPVGDGGKGPRAVAQQYREAGLTDVTCTLYPGRGTSCSTRPTATRSPRTSSAGSTRTCPADRPAPSGRGVGPRPRFVHETPVPNRGLVDISG